MPGAAAAHGMPGEEGARTIRAVLLGHQFQHGDDFQFAQRQFAPALRRNGGALLDRLVGLAEDGRQPQRIAIGAHGRESQRRNHDVAMLLGELAHQSVAHVEIGALVGAGAMQEQQDGQRVLAIPRGGHVEAVGHGLPGGREHVLALLVAGGARRGGDRRRAAGRQGRHAGGASDLVLPACRASSRTMTVEPDHSVLRCRHFRLRVMR